MKTVFALAAILSLVDVRAESASEASSENSEDAGSWHKDVSFSLPKSEFVKIGSTLITARPVDLGWSKTTATTIEVNGCDSGNVNCAASARAFYPDRAQTNLASPVLDGTSALPWVEYADRGPNIGSAASDNTVFTGDGSNHPVHLNSFAGAGHAHCLALSVEKYEHDYPFRVCSYHQIQALTAVQTMPINRWVMTLQSEDGDDYGVGAISAKVDYEYKWGKTGPFMDYSSPSKDSTDLGNYYFLMQAFEGPDDFNVESDEAPDGLVAYCCAGPEIPHRGEQVAR